MVSPNGKSRIWSIFSVRCDVRRGGAQRRSAAYVAPPVHWCRINRTGWAAEAAKSVCPLFRSSTFSLLHNNSVNLLCETYDCRASTGAAATVARQDNMPTAAIKKRQLPSRPPGSVPTCASYRQENRMARRRTRRVDLSLFHGGRFPEGNAQQRSGKNDCQPANGSAQNVQRHRDGQLGAVFGEQVQFAEFAGERHLVRFRAADALCTLRATDGPSDNEAILLRLAATARSDAGRGDRRGQRQISSGHRSACVGQATIAGRRFGYACSVLTTHDLPRPHRRGFS